MGGPLATQVIQETMIKPLLLRSKPSRRPASWLTLRLAHKKRGLTSGVSAGVMSRAQTETALVIRCSRVQRRRYQTPMGGMRDDGAPKTESRSGLLRLRNV
jgi:hypothetical protein